MQTFENSDTCLNMCWLSTVAGSAIVRQNPIEKVLYHLGRLVHSTRFRDGLTKFSQFDVIRDSSNSLYFFAFDCQCERVQPNGSRGNRGDDCRINAAR